MITHAFFKALLFLGAGSVIHGMHDEQDMRRMGGLRKFMPITAGTFIIGWLAISGIYPVRGFLVEGRDPGQGLVDPETTRCGAIGAVAALLTAFYMTRQVWLVFFGPERVARRRGASRSRDRTYRGRGAGGRGADHGAPEHGLEPHESPWTMYVPLVALAGLTFVGGALDLPLAKASSTCSTAGSHFPRAPPDLRARGRRALDDRARDRCDRILLAIHFYRNGLRADGTDPAVERLGGFAGVLENAWYIDYGIARFVSGPVTAFARFLSDGVDKGRHRRLRVNGIGTAARESGGGLAAAPDRSWCATTHWPSRLGTCASSCSTHRDPG